MAISKIKKLELIGLKNQRIEVLSCLQKLGIIELIGQKEINPSPDIKEIPSDTNLLEIEEALEYLAGFEEKGGLLEGIVKLKVLIYKKEMEQVVKDFNYLDVLKNLSSIRNNLKNLYQQKERLLSEKHILRPWRKLGIPLDKLHLQGACGIFLGIVNTKDYENIFEAAKKENIAVFSEIIFQDNVNTYLLFIYLNKDFEKLEIILKDRHFNFITLSRYNGTIKEKLYDINSEVLIIDDTIEDLKKDAAEFSKERFRLMVVYDYLANIKKNYEADKNLSKEMFTFVLKGFVRKQDLKLLESSLSSKFNNLAVFYSDPLPEEDIPIALENKPAISPFEAVTNLYGQPVYKGTDPTAFLAPFFAISFGLCMADAGYGLILMFILLYYLKKKQISQNGKNFLRFFLFMSFATIFAGIITGGFFADLIQRLPEQFNFLKIVQKRLTLFDPIKDSLLFLGIALTLGYIQIWAGVFIKFIKDLRSDKFSAFVLTLPTLLVQTSLLMLVLAFAKIIPFFMINFAFILLAMSCAFVIYYQWKSNPDIAQKMFWSVFGVYSIITGNFLADTLSFSRVFALGIASGLLAMAINEILLPKAPPTNLLGIVGMLILVILWIAVQTLVMGLSVLGAYVQTSRLQYLEFFTKFFESGGRPFRPFKEESKYTFLKE